MRSVESHFTDAKEKELALLVWRKGTEQLDKFQVLSGNGATKVFLANATIQNERIMLLASDWISFTRGDGEPGSSESVCAAVGVPAGYFNGNQIANVEHAYRAAFLSITLSPAVSFLGAGAWELIVDPLLKEPAFRAMNASEGLEGAAFWKSIAKSLRTSYGYGRLKDSYTRNGGQFVGADMAGWMMGADLWDEYTSTGGRGDKTFTVADGRLAQLRLQNGTAAFNQMAVLAGQKSAADAGTPSGDDEAPWPVTGKGTMLSSIAGARYGDVTLWPLIWDYNVTTVGPNPNIVPVGISIKVRKKDKYTAAQIADAKKRSPTWKNYPTK